MTSKIKAFTPTLREVKSSEFVIYNQEINPYPILPMPSIFEASYSTSKIVTAALILIRAISKRRKVSDCEYE
ncbi:hypothetical protein KA005_53470 [bacterium]|nr:hypothetical protein [bacterium]